MSIFRGINRFGESTTRTIIRENIMAKLSQAMIDAGGYYNFPTGVLGFDGNDLSLLRPSYRPEYANFRFWAGNSSNWVWETQSPTYTGGAAPIQISGVHISGVFYPEKNGGHYDHYIDYARGGVVFTNPMPSGLQVRCQRSERVGFIYPSIGPEYRKIFNAHLRNWQNSPPGSGYDEITQEVKAFMPAVFVDIKRTDGEAYELGSAVRIDRFSISFDIITEDTIFYDFLMDCCNSLQDQTIAAYNVDQARAGNAYGLNFDGTLNPNRKSFDQRSASYPWKTIRFLGDASEIDTFMALPVIRGAVAVDLEVII
jgi:hypothetical protein